MAGLAPGGSGFPAVSLSGSMGSPSAAPANWLPSHFLPGEVYFIVKAKVSPDIKYYVFRVYKIISVPPVGLLMISFFFIVSEILKI
jgi:hypothetical protein